MTFFIGTHLIHYLQITFLCQKTVVSKSQKMLKTNKSTRLTRESAEPEVPSENARIQSEREKNISDSEQSQEQVPSEPTSTCKLEIEEIFEKLSQTVDLEI